jgi:superfamily II DNA helicase RecQ
MSALVPKVTRELTRMRRTLRDTFGLDKLRRGQSEVMRSVLEGNNTLAIMPTGAGKSLCYLSRLSEEKVEKDKQKLERMMQYGQSAACRWRLLHDYFGEEMEEQHCGNCDNCLHPLMDQIALPEPRRAGATL